MNYYEKIIQEKKNAKEKENISDRAIALAMSYLKDGWKEDKIKKEMMSQYHISEVQALSAIDFAKKSLHNSKEKGYYQSIIEKKNQIDPDNEMKKLKALKPIVEVFKQKGMTKHEVAMRLYKEKDISQVLAQQAVDAFY